MGMSMHHNIIKGIIKEMEQDMSIKARVGMQEFQVTVDPDHHNINNKISIMILIMVKLIIIPMIIIKINQRGQIY